MNKKQKALIECYCKLPHRNSSRYISYIEAGYIGSIQACDDLFDSDKIQKAINARIKELKESLVSYDFVECHGVSEYSLQSLEKSLSYGLTNRKACEIIGIDPSTMMRWIRKGKKAYELADPKNKDNSYIKVYERLNKAKSTGENRLLSTIIKAGTEPEYYNESKIENGPNGIKTVITSKRIHPQWQAAAWVLERTRRDVYGPNAILPEDEHVTPADQIKHDVEAMKMLLATDGEPFVENEIIDIENDDENYEEKHEIKRI